ncbi:hypothetical protein GCM10010215_75650 [Streptomyces virginiae]|uniref:Uncharacterized protein n=1 Tax=Streptomyces virginiae TaxID=1961 RepID=A0ABQ3NNZ2_STRVG|nr:hypothetical protein GCM10010215_75650 [Streptomyces virginiae]GHI14493.1 hypothetical protein Scinn_39560 [Streptomyces virginiae]GLV93004.1 hypothetical protein Slala04_44580 [Streptomyces lavendulae subsp. lavendulae]
MPALGGVGPAGHEPVDIEQRPRPVGPGAQVSACLSERLGYAGPVALYQGRFVVSFLSFLSFLTVWMSVSGASRFDR